MSKLRCHIAISLDGFVAGPDPSEANPLGEGGERLHEWMAPLAAWRAFHGGQLGEVNKSTQIFEQARANVGAGVMGRNMFGPIGGGAWGDEQWTGWWGDDAPYHYPVFILTHYPRDPVQMEGGTTFHFVTDGIVSALKHARDAAGGQDVRALLPAPLGLSGDHEAGPRACRLDLRRLRRDRDHRGSVGQAVVGPGYVRFVVIEK